MDAQHAASEAVINSNQQQLANQLITTTYMLNLIQIEKQKTNVSSHN